MGNNGDNTNIYEINALLFQLLSFMSEAERRKLHAVLMSKLPDAGIEKDLSALITSLSESKRCELLGKLLNRYHTKNSKIERHARFLELRRYPRKPIKIPTEVSKNGLAFMGWTQNISNSGAFIEVDYRFYIGQKINLIFSPPKIKKDIAITGIVARSDNRGIGVKFDGLLMEALRALAVGGSGISFP